MIIGNAGIFRYQTTAQILAGPFVRATNHSSPLTGLTTAQFNCYYYIGTGMTSGTYTTALNGPWAEVTTGYYRLWLSTVMTGSVGQGLIAFQVTASGDPLALRYTVVPQAIWDSMIGGTGVDLLQVDVRQQGGASFSTRSGDNIEAAFYNAGATATKIYNNLSTISTAGISTLSTADLNNISTFDVAEVVTISTGQLAGLSTLATANFNTMSTFTTANLAGISTLSTANLNNLSTFSADNVYDVLTHAELMKVVQAHFLGKTSFIGSALKLYAHDGTSFIGFTITTSDRTVTT